MKRPALVFAILACCSICSSSDTPKRTHIFGIANVRIRVSDFCKAKKFYSMAAGQHSYCPDDKKPIGGSIALYSSQMIGLNVNSLNSVLQLNQPCLLEEVGFFTDDAAALKNYLASQGFEVGELLPRPPSFTIHDPEGHLISFVERTVPPAEFRQDRPLEPRIIHAGFIVRDRAATEHFYKDILGFRPYWHGGMKDDQTDWVSMQVPDGTDWLEFMVNVEPNPDQRLRGIMNHIALGVPDIHAAQQQLLKNGVKLTEEPKIGRDGKWQLNLYDPDDTRIEFMEFTPVQKPCCSEFTGAHPKP